MAAIQFTDTVGFVELRNVNPAPADRFANWTPISRPYGDAVPTLASGALVMVRYRTDYGASFDLNGIGIVNALAPANLRAVPTATGGTIPAGTYYFKATAILATGETGTSSEVSVTTTGTTSIIDLAVSPVAQATGYRWYRGTTPGGESVYTQTVGAALTEASTSGTAGTPPLDGAGVNQVAYADRLIAHLLGGGTCTVLCEDRHSATYTCGLYPGTTPSLRMTDSRNLLYTLSAQVINLAGSPVRMDCVYQ